MLSVSSSARIRLPRSDTTHEVYTFRVVRVRRSESVTESHRAIDAATISIDTIPHGGLKITDKTAGKVYIVKRK